MLGFKLGESGFEVQNLAVKTIVACVFSERPHQFACG